MNVQEYLLVAVLFAMLVPLAIAKHSIAIVNGHKGGSEMLDIFGKHLAREYGIEFYNYRLHMLESHEMRARPPTLYHFNMFSYFIKHMHDMGKYKALIVVRHPFDVAVSLNRYLRTTKEEWTHDRTRYLRNQTIQEYVNTLSDDVGIVYAMTCPMVMFDLLNILNYLPDVEGRSDHKVMHLEDFKHSWNETLEGMLDFVGMIEGHPRERVMRFMAEHDITHFASKSHSSWQNATAALQAAAERYEFPKVFSCFNYMHFCNLFGFDRLVQLGYADSLPIAAREIARRCSLEVGVGVYGREQKEDQSFHWAQILHAAGTDVEKEDGMAMMERAGVLIESSDTFKHLNKDCRCQSASGFEYGFAGCASNHCNLNVCRKRTVIHI